MTSRMLTSSWSYGLHLPVILAILMAQVAAGADVVVSARDCLAHSSNLKPAHPNWDNLAVCDGEKGFAEWTCDLPAARDYFLHVYVASGERRPVALSINGNRLPGTHLGLSTGGFLSDSLQWTTLGPFACTAGRNTLRIDVTHFMPHLAGFVISTARNGWNQKAFVSVFSGATDRPVESGVEQARTILKTQFGTDEILFIKRITYTSNHYYTEYINSQWTPGGGIYVLSLKDGKERCLTTALPGGVFGRMDLSFDAKKVVFDWKRSENEGYRIYEVGIDGAGLHQVLPAPADEASLVARYRLGYHHGTDDMHPCYLPDGGIAFVSTRCQLGTLCDIPDIFTTTTLYRMDADGRNLKRLSFGALSEFTPTVMHDGRIMYSRWEYVDKGAVSVKCIWAMRPDGSASSEIYGNDIPFPPTMIQPRPIPGSPNRFVMLGCPHYPQNALGTIIRVDTTKPIRTDQPVTYLTPEVKVLAEGGWHFSDASLKQPLNDGSGRGPLFRDPFPFDEDHFLVAHKPRGYGNCYAPNGYGLYLLDSKGKVQPVYRDPDISCWQPIPLKLRPTPPVLPSESDPRLAKDNLARCIIADVYRGLENVPRGSIKYIRILEQIPRPWSARHPNNSTDDCFDQQHIVVSKCTALGLKVQHGVVPVEPDGSAHFLVPANADIFMQALDENYMAVQTERTFVNYMPGETRSCIGCHETPAVSFPSASGSPLAVRRAPSLPGPQPGETTGRHSLHYPTDVQPVLDHHCVSCHNEKKKDGNLDLTGRLTRFFSVSYENLIPDRCGARKGRVDPGLVPTIGENHPKTGNVRYFPARSLGSHNSLLVAMLARDKVHYTGDPDRLNRLVQSHKDVHLKPEELLKITNWVDTNAQYYGSYFGRRNLKDKDAPDFRPVPTWESAIGLPQPCLAIAPALPSIRHRFLAVDESRGQLHYVDQFDPKLDWTIKLPEKCRDIQLIGANKVMLSLSSGYIEYDLKTQKPVKEFRNPTIKGGASVRRLPDGHTLIGANQDGLTFYDMDTSDRIIRTAAFPKLNTLRLMRLSPRGTLLFGANEKFVIEANLTGKILRQIPLEIGKHLYQVLEKPDGRLLVATGYGATVTELDPQGKPVRQFGGLPAPAGIFFQFFSGMQVLRNGQLVVCNWTGHGAADSEKGDQLIQFDPEGKIVWAWHDARRAGTLHGIIVLDDLDPSVLTENTSAYKP